MRRAGVHARRFDHSPCVHRPGRRYIGEVTQSPELLLVKEQVIKVGGVQGDMQTTAVWYCLNGSILACPDLHTLVASRLVSV